MVQGSGFGVEDRVKRLGSSSQFKNNLFTEMCCGTEAGSYLRLTDSCITQLKALGPARTCNESKEEEEKVQGSGFGVEDRV